MSGGSFNYVCFKMEENPLEALRDLRDMESWLREQKKHDAADEVLALIQDIEAAQRRLAVRVKRIQDVVRAAEWWCSGDYGEDSFDEVVKRLYSDAPMLGSNNGKGESK